MDKKKKTNIVIKILGLFFIVYVALFIASSSGYYEARVKDKVTITDDKIKEFENIVAKGDAIDINSFLDNEREDYRSQMSNLGDNITKNLETIMEEGVSVISQILKSLF